ncbi:MAG: DUF3810 domain-containing protein, partial [Chitinophagaceae bacterium]|nr:DUF3810 domain-containing protein [Chitinophagaceae bacterium]
MARKNVWIIMLSISAILIKIFSLFPPAVERYYSTGIYPYIAVVQRILFGWLPLSVGDIFYFATGVWLITQVILIVKKIRGRQAGGKYFISVARRFIAGCLLVYVSFNLLWGLNYNRTGISGQLKLNNYYYSDKDLLAVTKILAQKINAFQPASERSRHQLDTKKHLFGQAVQAYMNIKNTTPLYYIIPSVKPSIYSYLGNYLGFTGYYNPFTGEAQVNTTVPLFVRPFTVCHEIGHQLGYAKESEANFAGYLSASASTDTSFLYSVYFDMYLYSARYLYYSDSSSLKEIKQTLSPGVTRDKEELYHFLDRYSTPVEEVIDRLYSKYLMANEQPSGKMSYNEVVAMLIA